MQDAISIQIQGLPELQKKFSALSAKAQRGDLRKALRAATRPVIKDARIRVPVASGLLKKQIKASVSVKRTFAQARIGFGSKAFYGMFIELGSRFIAARPFLRPAFDAKKTEVVETFNKKLTAELLKVAKA